MTGANGYLGSQLASHYTDKHSVACLVRREIKGGNNKLFISTTDNNWIDQIIDFRPDVVINAIACYGRNSEPFSELLNSNVLFPISLLEALSRLKITFINCGTSLPENLNAYSYTKQKLSEMIGFVISGTDNKYIELKLEHFFGAFDSDSKFTSMIIRKCLNNENIRLTSGEQIRDFIYIKDLLFAFDCILNNVNLFEKTHTIEIGTGVPISIRNFVETVHNITGSRSMLEFGAVSQRTNELMYSCANIKSLENIGWHNKYSLSNAISEIISKERK
ncbi:NAD-dependent epimerase/dehydratase [Yokenella regensburgei]|uniref:NAD-dependent epimerase/dehydratase n=1 Tax=Yokenella regensburgei TaxID=158877 RepID=UPI003EDA3A81